MECSIEGEANTLIYTAQGDDVKSKPFNALMGYAFGVYIQAAQMYGWDTGVGLQPLQLARYDYWLVFDEINIWKQPTWRMMTEVLGLIEHCYSIGHVEEFTAKILISGSRFARGRLFFKRDPRSAGKSS